jgi:hypothetical protein
MNPNTSYTVVSISGGTDEQGPYAAGCAMDVAQASGHETDKYLVFSRTEADLDIGE